MHTVVFVTFSNSQYSQRSLESDLKTITFLLIGNITGEDVNAKL